MKKHEEGGRRAFRRLWRRVTPPLGLDLDAQKQLDFDEQQRVMSAIGMKESDLPEILVHDFRRNGYLPEACSTSSPCSAGAPAATAST
jgi:hypothetical protein